MNIEHTHYELLVSKQGWTPAFYAVMYHSEKNKKGIKS